MTVAFGRSVHDFEHPPDAAAAQLEVRMSEAVILSPPLPDGTDLQARLRFAPSEGRIWLDGQRMLLLHVESFGALRKELITSQGIAEARRLLTRMGYVSGLRDADMARRIRGDRSVIEAFHTGPQLHALEGIVQVEPVRMDIDLDSGRYFGEFLWHDSSEDSAHLSEYGIGDEPACWMQLGYASGYTTAFMGRPILYREVQCRSMGDRHCRIIGRPLEEWTDSDLTDADVAHFRDTDPKNQEENYLVGRSTAFRASVERIQRVSDTDTTVLILGETGVGKGRMAQLLHERSRRRSGPFVTLNCAAVPETLLEAELFGVMRGAYTGAVQSRPGKFERAHGGTLFLDEIGTMPLQAQAKLLRALQEREIERVGDTRTRHVDVRVVAATNVDLCQEVNEGRFRRDLYYRVNVFPVRLAALRERRDDIRPLVDHFLTVYAERSGRHIRGLTDRALSALLAYDFPGNIRELENMVERAVVLAGDGGRIDVQHLFDESIQGDARLLGISDSGTLEVPLPGGKPGSVSDLVGALLEEQLPFEELERRLLEAAVERADGNLSEAARVLGLSRPQVAYRLRKHRDG